MLVVIKRRGRIAQQQLSIPKDLGCICYLWGRFSYHTGLQFESLLGQPESILAMVCIVLEDVRSQTERPSKNERKLRCTVLILIDRVFLTLADTVSKKNGCCFDR